MKAYVLAEPGKGVGAWKMVEQPDPVPGPGEVLIGVRATSLNHRDLMIANGSYGGGPPKKDLIPLSDGAGEVLAVGAGVSPAFQPGDKVVGSFFQKWTTGPLAPEYHSSALGGGKTDGMLAEKVVLRAGGVVRMNDGMTFAEAATLPCAGVTAWNALFESFEPLKPGSVVLIQGTGGVSIFAYQFAKAAGLRVIAISSSNEKLDRLRGLGLMLGINYTEHPEWEREVEVRKGGVDEVIEVAGSTLPHSLRTVKLGGRIALIGGLGGWHHQVTVMDLFRAQARIQPIFVGSVEMFKRMNRAVEVHQIKPVIDEVFPFDRANDALAKLESGTHFGKIVVKVA